MDARRNWDEHPKLRMVARYKAATFTALSPLTLLLTPALAAAPISGLARAKDGDSLMVGTTEVRLFGIDARANAR